jgi:hypothetical protein
VPIDIGNTDFESTFHNGGWDALCVSDHRVIIKSKPYYKMDAFRGLLLAGLIFVLAVEFFIHDIYKPYFLIPIALFILAAIYISVFRPLKTFKGFEIEVYNGGLTVNNKNVSEVCMFAVCDPDDNSFVKNLGFWGMFGFESQSLSGRGKECPTINIGFQFITKNEIFYARGNIGPFYVKGMQSIFDFLLKNKIKFTYKYKEIRPHLRVLSDQFKRFENEFDLDLIESFETDVQGAKRYIRKEDKYPSDGILYDQIKTKQNSI